MAEEEAEDQCRMCFPERVRHLPRAHIWKMRKQISEYLALIGESSI